MISRTLNCVFQIVV